MSTRLLCCSGSLDGGGSERQLWQLATRVDATRFASHLYLIYRRGTYLTQVPAHIPVYAFESEGRAGGRSWPGAIHRRQVAHLAQVIRAQRIELVYDRTFHMTLVTAPACRRTATPRVSVIVSPPSQDFARSRERFRWLKKRLLQRAYRDPMCDVLTVSDSVADDAARFYGLARSRIQTVPSPIDVAALEQAAAQELDGNGPSESPTTRASTADTNEFRVVVVGRLSAEKGQRLAIEALAVLRQRLRERLPKTKLRLDLIGDGPDRAALQQVVEKLDLGAHVHFAGFQQNPYRWIAQADLLCLPSEYEGLPNVLLEAMCLRTPIVATNCSGAVRELLDDGGRGKLLHDRNPETLATALLERMQQAAPWLERAATAATWVRRRHGLQPWLERMQDLFERRLDGRPA